MAGTDFAPDDQTWVCTACGRTSRTKYGFDASGVRCADHGWDESCMMNAELCKKEHLTFDTSGRVVMITEPVKEAAT